MVEKESSNLVAAVVESTVVTGDISARQSEVGHC